MIKRFLLVLGIVCSFGLSAVAQINTSQVLANARNALYFEDYVLSIQYLNKVITAKPYLSEPYYLRAYAKYSLEDIQGALIDCDKALSINPFHADTYNLRGIIKQQADDHEAAIIDFSKGLEYAPDHTNLLTNRANSKLSLDDFKGAIDDYNKIIFKEPGLLSAYLNRGIAKINNKDTIGAITDFSKVITKNPFSPNGYWYRAIVYSQMANYEKALVDFDKVIDLQPENPSAYLNRGVTRYQLDDLRGTMADLDKAIALDQKNSAALLNRGMIRAEVGDLNKAVEDFSRALAINPADLITLFNRAIINLQLGQAKLALTDLNIIIENKPTFSKAYAVRSQAKAMLNDEKGAMIDQNTAFKLDMDQREKQELAYKNREKESPVESDSTAVASTKKKKGTRNSSDAELTNYDKVAVLNDFEVKEKETEKLKTVRGRIQNYDFFVDLEPMFAASLAQSDSLVVRIKYFDKDLERLNKLQILGQRLQFSNHDQPTTKSSKNFYLATEVTNYMVQFGINADLLMVRGVLMGAVMNFNQAIADYTESLNLMPSNKLALNNRAIVRYKMVSAIQAMEEPEVPAELQVQSPIAAKPTTTTNKNQTEASGRIIDFDFMMKDLNSAIDLDKNFALAYYNRGFLFCVRKDFDAALADFTKAISINPDFAEAYYNRGLTYIYMKKEAQGIEDLSKAGELGLFKAYNVIKRYKVQPK